MKHGAPSLTWVHEDDDMQIRSSAHLQFISLRRLLRGLIPPHDNDAPASTSPLVLFTAVVLALLLAILEVDLYWTELESIGLVSNDYPVPPVLMGP